ncbi:MAG: MtnX-like HAD-IB family phosphatase [Chloroflexota bacterium]
MKTVVQCDFDGTVTTEDASYFLLDAFAQGDWRAVLREYEQDKITVGEFNSRVFSMVAADERTLVETVRQKVQLRPGLQELTDYCCSHGLRLVIVSNGLEFYIHALLAQANLRDVEVHAAQACFDPDGVKVSYVGPDGSHVDNGLKETYVQRFLSQGYRVVYVGNGRSDRAAARQAHEIFATEELLDFCRQEQLRCHPFIDLTDVVRGLRTL